MLFDVQPNANNYVLFHLMNDYISYVQYIFICKGNTVVQWLAPSSHSKMDLGYVWQALFERRKTETEAILLSTELMTPFKHI